MGPLIFGRVTVSIKSHKMCKAYILFGSSLDVQKIVAISIITRAAGKIQPWKQVGLHVGDP